MGTPTDGGHNLEYGSGAPAATCGFSVNNQTGDPKLGALSDNGGPTQTLALGTGSAAIDTGDDAVCAQTGAGKVNGVDQRSMHRPQGPHCDIGAFEFIAAYSTVVNNSGDGVANTLNCVVGNASACRLRDAIAVVNGGLASGTTITFDATAFPANTAKTITLTAAAGGTMHLASTLTIDGTGHAVTIGGGNALGLLEMDSGTATLTALTLTGGNTGGGGGAVIVYGGTLVIANSTLTGNTAALGGALDLEGGTTAVTNSTLTGNSATAGAGGAICASSPLTVTNSTLVGNSSSGGGQSGSSARGRRR